ncbi:MAG: 50S ribosomal protein L18 [Omnitrophica WOR_2 bacterium RBG_13_44_8b]|nr:MAG: 50S ribosomal protein L18 [Omnitrophica WOR_2 bacterium RBG_13_44_8b]
MNKNKREERRLKRHRRIKLRMRGTKELPRLIVKRSLKNISAQVIDDAQNQTLFSLSSQDKEVKQKFAQAGNIKAAEFFGEVFAHRAKEKGIAKVVFDRAGYLYHGRIKSFADALRKGGLQF